MKVFRQTFMRVMMTQKLRCITAITRLSKHSKFYRDLHLWNHLERIKTK